MKALNIAEKIIAWRFKKEGFAAEAVRGRIFVAPGGFLNRIRLKFGLWLLPRETVVYFLPEPKPPAGKFLRAFQEDELHDPEKLVQALEKKNPQGILAQEHKPLKKN